MQLAIFGIDNDGLNLAVNLFVYSLVVVWLALGVWTYLDARRRIEDPVIVICAAVAGFVPFIGPFVYSILRPPEFLEDAKERELEIKAAELRVRQLSELTCSNCGFPVEKTYLRCPNCQRRLKDPCQSCGKPVDPRWALCPYCETALPGRQARRPQPQEAARAQPQEASEPPRRKPATRAASRPSRERPARGRRAQPKQAAGPQAEQAPAPQAEETPPPPQEEAPAPQARESKAEDSVGPPPKRQKRTTGRKSSRSSSQRSETAQRRSAGKRD